MLRRESPSVRSTPDVWRTRPYFAIRRERSGRSSPGSRRTSPAATSRRRWQGNGSLMLWPTRSSPNRACTGAGATARKKMGSSSARSCLNKPPIRSQPVGSGSCRCSWWGFEFNFSVNIDRKNLHALIELIRHQTQRLVAKAATYIYS